MIKLGSRIAALCAAGAGAVLCGLALLWPEPREQSPFALAVGVWPGMETLTLAREQGLLPERGLMFVELSWTSATMMAFENRIVDGAVVTLNEMLRLKAGGHEIKAVLVIGASDGGDALVSRPHIASVEALRGKRVGVELRASGEYLLTRALRSAGMSFNDVVIVPMNSAEAQMAYEQRELDAVVTRDPWLMRLTGKGARVLFDSSQLPQPLHRVLVVRQDLLKDRHKVLRTLVRAHFDSLPALQSAGSDGTGRDAVLRREQLTGPEFQECLKRIKFFSREENIELLREGAGGLNTALREMAEFMMEEGLLDKGVKWQDMLDARLVKGDS